MCEKKSYLERMGIVKWHLDLKYILAFLVLLLLLLLLGLDLDLDLLTLAGFCNETQRSAHTAIERSSLLSHGR